MRTFFVGMILALTCLVPNAAEAWLRPVYEDTTVVERSELIVVGHIEEGSID